MTFSEALGYLISGLVKKHAPTNGIEITGEFLEVMAQTSPPHTVAAFPGTKK